MINPLTTYRECGVKAGRAARQQDWALHDHLRGWFLRAGSIESLADLPAIKAEYEAGYAEGNPPRTFEPFR